MSKKNQSPPLLVTNKNILDVLADNWKHITEIQDELKIEDLLDNRLLKIKLKLLERKELIKSKRKEDNNYYKLISNLNNIEEPPYKNFSKDKKDFLNHSQSKQTTDASYDQTLYDQSKSNNEELNLQSNILKINRYQKSIELQKARLRRDPYNSHLQTRLKRVQSQLNALTNELEKHSYFICLYCKKVFRNKNKLNNHIHFKHNIRPIECLYCDERFISESDL